MNKKDHLQQLITSGEFQRELKRAEILENLFCYETIFNDAIENTIERIHNADHILQPIEIDQEPSDDNIDYEINEYNVDTYDQRLTKACKALGSYKIHGNNTRAYHHIQGIATYDNVDNSIVTTIFKQYLHKNKPGIVEDKSYRNYINFIECGIKGILYY